MGAADVRQVIADLARNGADKFDPLRFRVIESMAARAAEQRESVRLILERKALIALADYEDDFASAQAGAATIAAAIAAQFPESADIARSLFEEGKVHAMKRLAVKLKRENGREAGASAVSALASLTKQIGQNSFGSAEEDKDISFVDLLRRQEEAVLQSSLLAKSQPRSGAAVVSDKLRAKRPGGRGSSSNRAGESTSARQLRELLDKHGSDKRVKRAISEGPEAPGPLNPQALAIRSLATLRELSPDYLSRFVAYADTLLWLEQAGEKSKLAGNKGKTSKPKSSRVDRA
ncbi:MAG: DUF2894 domain-containing protein [Candidatus Accumulibacter meliphilus]|uniref:DUF2894 domain-containing protein n=1 Tax=Candidatus Accumulibacter meliphilus TaxID=2211374 RepID=UPI002FC2AA58